MNVKCFRKKLESTERLLEPVPIIGILTGRFNTSFRNSVLCGLCHFCHVSFSCTPVNSDFDLFVYLLSLNLQQKLWSSSQELKHGTLTCPAHDHEIRSSPFQVKYFPSVKASFIWIHYVIITCHWCMYQILSGIHSKIEVYSISVF